MLPSGEINYTEYTELVKGGGFEAKFKELDDNAKSALSNNPEFTTSLLGMLKDQGSFLNAAEALKVINPYMSLVLRVQAESQRIVAEKNRNTPAAPEPVSSGNNDRKSFGDVFNEVKKLEDAIEYNPILVKQALLAIMNLDPKTQNFEGEVTKLTDRVLGELRRMGLETKEMKDAVEVVNGTAKIMAGGISTSSPKAGEQKAGAVGSLTPDVNGPYGGIPGRMQRKGEYAVPGKGAAVSSTAPIAQAGISRDVGASAGGLASVPAGSSATRIDAPATSDYDRIDAARRLDAAIAAGGGTSASGVNGYAELIVAPNDGPGIASGASVTTTGVPGYVGATTTGPVAATAVDTPYPRGNDYGRSQPTAEGVSGAKTANPTPVAASVTIDAGPKTEDERKKVQEIEGKDNNKEADKKSKSEGIIGFLNKDSTKRYFFGGGAIACAFVAPPLAVMFAAAMIVNELTPVLKPVFATCAVGMMIVVETAMNLIKAVANIVIAVKNLVSEEKTDYLSINFDLTKQTFDFMKDAMKSEKAETKSTTPKPPAIDASKKTPEVSEQRQIETDKSKVAAITTGAPSTKPTPASSTSLGTTTPPSSAHSNAADVAKQTLTGASAGSSVHGNYTSVKSAQNTRS